MFCFKVAGTVYHEMLLCKTGSDLIKFGVSNPHLPILTSNFTKGISLYLTAVHYVFGLFRAILRNR